MSNPRREAIIVLAGSRQELSYIQRRVLEMIEGRGMGNKEMARVLTAETGQGVSRNEIKRVRWELTEQGLLVKGSGGKRLIK